MLLQKFKAHLEWKNYIKCRNITLERKIFLFFEDIKVKQQQQEMVIH